MSAPRNWSQGKASTCSPSSARPSVRPSELESRQSAMSSASERSIECPPLGIGIKAKPQKETEFLRNRVSAPRNWNQGKAEPCAHPPPSSSVRPSELESRQSSRMMRATQRRSVRPSELESRQSSLSHRELPIGECPPLGIGIKAKRRSTRPSSAH